MKGRCTIITLYSYKPILLYTQNVFVLFLSDIYIYIYVFYFYLIYIIYIYTAINVNVQHDGGFLPGIILFLTQCYY